MLSRTLRLALLAALAAAASPVRADYAPASVFVPDSGIGMVSEYAGVVPTWGGSNQTVDVPVSGTNETNLVWTFWDHTRFDPSEWPAGPAARICVTVVAASTVTVRTASFYRAGNWSAPAPGPAITLPAGKPVTILVPLPPAPSEPVEVLRVLLEASEAMPALTITGWSVGNDPALATASFPAR